MDDDKTGKKIGNYYFDHIIGKGNYGKVYKARGDKDNQLYAVKCIQKKVFIWY